MEALHNSLAKRCKVRVNDSPNYTILSAMKQRSPKMSF